MASTIRWIGAFLQLDDCIAHEGFLLEGQIYKVKQCVVVNGEDGEWLGKILSIFEVAGQAMMEVQWFYHPHEVSENYTPHHEREVFLSNSTDEVPCESTIRKCKIERRDRITSLRKFVSQPDHYFYEVLYDVHNSKASSSDKKRKLDSDSHSNPTAGADTHSQLEPIAKHSKQNQLEPPASHPMEISTSTTDPTAEDANLSSRSTPEAVNPPITPTAESDTLPASPSSQDATSPSSPVDDDVLSSPVDESNLPVSPSLDISGEGKAAGPEKDSPETLKEVSALEWTCRDCRTKNFASAICRKCKNRQPKIRLVEIEVRSPKKEMLSPGGGSHRSSGEGPADQQTLPLKSALSGHYGTAPKSVRWSTEEGPGSSTSWDSGLPSTSGARATASRSFWGKPSERRAQTRDPRVSAWDNREADRPRALVGGWGYPQGGLPTHSEVRAEEPDGGESPTTPGASPMTPPQQEYPALKTLRLSVQAGEVDKENLGEIHLLAVSSKINAQKLRKLEVWRFLAQVPFDREADCVLSVRDNPAIEVLHSKLVLERQLAVAKFMPGQKLLLLPRPNFYFEGFLSKHLHPGNIFLEQYDTVSAELVRDKHQLPLVIALPVLMSLVERPDSPVIKKRPGLDEFMEQITPRFSVSIFTTASQETATAVASLLKDSSWIGKVRIAGRKRGMTTQDAQAEILLRHEPALSIIVDEDPLLWKRHPEQVYPMTYYVPSPNASSKALDALSDKLCAVRQSFLLGIKESERGVRSVSELLRG